MSEIITFVKEFDTCPGCGSAERYYENLLREMQERGLVDKKANCFDFQIRQGVPLTDERVGLLAFGSEVPSYNQIWDTCCGCGMIYSTHLERGVVRKSLDVPQVPANKKIQLNRLSVN